MAQRLAGVGEGKALIDSVIPLDLAARQLRLAILMKIMRLLMHQLVMLEWLLLTCVPPIQVRVNVNIIPEIRIFACSYFAKRFLCVL